MWAGGAGVNGIERSWGIEMSTVPPGSEVAGQPPAAGLGRVLLVDDDPDLREAVRRGLQRLGYSVQTACNGVDAARRLEERLPDVMVLDIVMPVRDGIETLMEVRQRNLDLRVIVVSGGGQITSMDYLGMARLLGASRVLEKPFTLDELDAAIREEMGSRGPRGPE